MSFDFDNEISRTGTGSIKWEFIANGKKMLFNDHTDPKHGKDRVLPMWVSDMDFPSPPAVIDALAKRVQHGIFGYTERTDAYFDTVISWIVREYGYAVEEEWIVTTPGVVPAIYLAIHAFTNPGDKVLIQQPVYHPFIDGIEDNGRIVVSNSLVLENGRYQMDFDDLAIKAADPDVKLALLCSPHNPVGRVWTLEELRRFGDICLANDVLVVSDEIHCDLIFNGITFTSFAKISEPFFQNSIICTAASKSFNLAGLKTSNIIIPNQEIRDAFQQTKQQIGIGGINALGLVATEAAYTHGRAWLDGALAYIQSNYHFLDSFLKSHLPMLNLIECEGTYLVWLDCRALGMDNATRKAFFMEQVKLYVSPGEQFGIEGEGFIRLNLACPQSILAEAMERLKTAVSTRTITLNKRR